MGQERDGLTSADDQEAYLPSLLYPHLHGRRWRCSDSLARIQSVRLSGGLTVRLPLSRGVGALIPQPGWFWRDWTRSYFSTEAGVAPILLPGIVSGRSSLYFHLAGGWLSQYFLIPYTRYQQGSVGSQGFCPDPEGTRQCDSALCFLSPWCQQDLKGSWVYTSAQMQWDSYLVPCFQQEGAREIEGGAELVLTHLQQGNVS